jgi:hypothetical protein
MSIPTQQNPMKLSKWEQQLYDSGIHKGRFERGVELARSLTDIRDGAAANVESEPENSEEQWKALIAKLDGLLTEIRSAAKQHAALADQLLVSADIERDRYELRKSRFTARSIAAIMEVTAGDRD